MPRPTPDTELPGTAMPRTALGKIQKFQLQHDLLEKEQGPDGGQPLASVRDT